MIELSQIGSTATVVMDSPPVNAVNEDFLSRFEEVLDEVERLGSANVLRIRSAQRVFCAGADISRIDQFFSDKDGPRNMVVFVRKIHALFDRIERFPAATIAEISGTALGGGLELALSCDLRIAAHEAKLGLPEAKIGMIPGAGGTQRLSRICGLGVANKIIVGCEVVDGREAERLGIVGWSAPRADLEARTDALVEHIAGLSRPALIAAKDCIAAGYDPLADGFERELEAPLTLMKTKEAVERIGAFLKK